MLLNNKKEESRVKFDPGLSANRPSNNWAQAFKSADVEEKQRGLKWTRPSPESWDDAIDCIRND